MRQCLIPESHGGDVVLQWEVPTLPVGPPAERLYRHTQVRFEADWVHDVPAIHAEALLRLVDSVGPDHLREARIRGREWRISPGILRFVVADVEIVGAAKVIFRPG